MKLMHENPTDLKSALELSRREQHAGYNHNRCSADNSQQWSGSRLQCWLCGGGGHVKRKCILIRLPRSIVIPDNPGVIYTNDDK